MRARLVVGNWKMNGSRAVNRALLVALLTDLGDVGCAVCVPYPYLGEVAEQLRGTPLAWGAQNVSEHAQGAYTGEVSAAMLREFGCRYVLVGHSERRQIFAETDAQVAAKFAAASAAGITPILCVGETLAEREAGRTEEVVARQLAAVKFSDAVLAYEPVWAIGTGKTATADQAQAVHAFLRKRLEEKGQADTTILYGGSVKAQNAAALFGMPDIDGGLIGGASLVAREFADIVKAAEK